MIHHRLTSSLAAALCFCSLLFCPALQAYAADDAATLQQQLNVLDRTIKDQQATLDKSASPDTMLVIAAYGDADAALVGAGSIIEMVRGMFKGDRFRGMIVAVPRDVVANDIARRVITGDIAPSHAARYGQYVAQMSKVLALLLKREIENLRAERRFVAQKLESARGGGPKPTTPPGATTGGGAKASGYWRLKEGYPKVKAKEECATLNQSNMRADLSASDSSITVDYAALHGSTKEVTHSFTIQVDYTGLGKVSYEAGEETRFTLSGTWSYGKDGGGLNAAYPVLGYTGGVAVTEAEPRRGNRSAASCAQLWLGRVSGGDALSDKREITLKMPGPGKEFSLDIGISGYGGAGMVTWVYEWVPR